MSILSTLKLSNARRTADANDPAQKARQNVLKALTEQRAAVEAAIKGEKFQAKRGKGEKAVDKKFRAWWFKQGNVFHTEVRYGVAALDLGQGNTSIECGPKLEDVLSTFDVIRQAVEAGELDKPLAAASAKRGRKGSKQAPAEPASTPAKGKATRAA
ncbi:hypothetical protein [Roseomonas chloroacetimidivorans]|uniref:hypothetical protein n=1 Tax=Roseomonas chloroacetimidivorans TaxID=1766656 RepID=UPI003C75C5C6